MPRPKLRLVILCLVFVAFVAAPATRGQNLSSSGQPPSPPAVSKAPTTVKLNLVVGGQTRVTSEQRWTKFEQSRDIPKNVTLSYLDFTVEKEGSPWHVSGRAQDATQLDQRYRLVLERYGRLRTEFRYDGYPNFISRLTRTPLTQASPGVFTMSATLRGALQAAPSSGVPALVNDIVRSTPFADLRTRRQRYALRQEFTISDRWDAFFTFLREHRSGLKPIGLGIYERAQTPRGGFFTVLGTELPEPINYRTTELRAGVGFHNRRALLRVEYGVSWFENRTAALRWDNPFSLTDREANPPGFGTGRWRFSTGQLDLYPDNTAQTVSVSGRVGLPGESFLTALASWSFWRQDDAFLPWTLNTAVVTGVPAGINPTSAASLPRASLDGQVNLFNSDVVLGTRKWDKFLLTGRYRVYRYDQQTPQLPLAGYVRYGDSFWGSSFSGVPLRQMHAPISFTRQQTSLEAAWKPVDEFQWKIEPFWEGWNRENRQANRTNEWGVKTQILYKPVHWFNARTHYRYASRKPQLYKPGVREFSALSPGSLPLPGGFLSGLRMFDQAHRNRNNADVTLNFGGKGPWSISATYNYLSEVYDRNFFGLGSYLQGTAGVDLNYAPSDRYGFVAYYNHDRIRHHARSIAKGAGAFTWALQNEWDRDTRDKVDSFGAGFNASAAEQKWQFNASYDFSFANQRINTLNPRAVRADAVNDAQAFPACAVSAVAGCWPDLKSRFHEFRLETSYRFRPSLEAGVRYLFEPYRLSDFSWDIMQPYMFGFEAPENDARRFLFLDSRYGTTNAHLVGVYLKYIF